jgi:toxin-antitoxin system PIN domain toxin
VMELPDVNVLIARFDPAHVHHEPSQVWFAAAREDGWATCPLTENGFLRVLSNPNYPNVRLTVAEAAARLQTLCVNCSQSYQFWSDDVSFKDAALFDLSAVQGHRQVTDLYLLGLCQRHDATLVTFDNGLPALIRAVVDAHNALLRVLTG